MEKNLLNEFVVENPRANKTLRFVNLLVDTIVFYIFAIFLGGLIGATSPELVDDASFNAMSYVISISIFLIYFTAFEFLTNGRTLGKFITGTRAVKEDG